MMSNLLLAATMLTATGYASRYDPGVFETVVNHRFANGWWRNEPPADWNMVAGYAATTDCGQVGKVVLMRPAGATTWERVLVADCPGDGSTLDWMLANNIAVELDYNLFTRWADGHGVPLEIEMRPAGVRDYVMRWIA